MSIRDCDSGRENIERIRKISLHYAIELLNHPRYMREISKRVAEEIFDNEHITIGIEGLENLSSGTPYLFVANHPRRSSVHKFLRYRPHHHIFLFEQLIEKYLGNRVHTIANYPKNPIPSQILKWADYIVLPKQGGGEKVREQLNESVEEYVLQGDSILIFPEGAEQTEGVINTFKKGMFHLSKNNNLSIVPVHMEGFYGLYENVRYAFGEPEKPPPDQTASEYVKSVRERIFGNKFGLDLVE